MATLQYYGWRIASAILGRLPLPVSYAIASLTGRLTFLVWRPARGRMLRNYRRVLPGRGEAEVRRAAAASLSNYCKYLVDFIRFPSLTAEELIRACEGESAFAALDLARLRGRGAIIVPMHFGNWDMGAGAAAARGYPATVVVETFADARLDAMVIGARERLGLKIVRMEKAGPSLIRLLRRNEMLALLIDRPTPGSGVAVEFFGASVEVPAGPARLALATGATVIPAAFRRVRRGSYEIAIMAEFIIPGKADKDGDEQVRALTQAIVAAHERFIHAYPEQWYMFREMWPRRGTSRA